MFGKAKDLVCGMKITKKTAAVTAQHMGKTFYFCSRVCKEKFDQDPLSLQRVYRHSDSVALPSTFEEVEKMGIIPKEVNRL